MTDKLLRVGSSTSLLTHLLDAPELVREVQALPPSSFSRLLRHVGLEDAGELVALATTEQLVGAFDEDLFRNTRPGRREVFDPARFVTWLEVLLEAGDAVAAHRVAELSEDFLVHAVNSLVIVLDNDALRDRMREWGEDADQVDKSLTYAQAEEIDGYLLVARTPDGWDALFSLVLALDRDHRALLERVLDRCVRISRELVDDLDALQTALSEGASVAEDVEADREARRSRAGYVEPRAARAFLALARQGKAAGPARDPISRAYFRELERPAPASSTTDGVPSSSSDRLLALLAELEDDDVPRGPASAAVHARRTLPRPDSRLVSALQALREHHPVAFAARMEELAFLANALAAGALVAGRRLRPYEASEAALATVALGAELEAAPSAGRATVDALLGVLRDRPAEQLFSTASAALCAGTASSTRPTSSAGASSSSRDAQASRALPSTSSGFLTNRAELEPALRELRRRRDARRR